MSFVKALHIDCDTNGCQAQADVPVVSEKEANHRLKSNGWLVSKDGKKHTCPWCKGGSMARFPK